MILEFTLAGIGIYSIYRINFNDEIKKRKFKKQIRETWGELIDIINLQNYTIDKIEMTNVGLNLIIEIPAGRTFTEVEVKKEHIEKAFQSRAILTDIKNSNKLQIDIIKNDIDNLDYNFIELLATQLLCGYDYKGNPIIADMLLTPHLLVTGLSGNGKTGCIRIMIKNLIDNNNADVMLLNAFMDDYEDLDINGITNHEEIKNYIQELLDGIEEGIKRTRPLYVIFEELGKVKDKQLIDLCTKLLQYGRHNKIYLIGVIQTATKEELKFKSLFNARLTFKQLEESSYRVVLGCSVDEKLKKREFYLFTDDLYKGKTYKLDF